MKNIITAVGNEEINKQLKEEKNINIVFPDIQYKEGILEILEINSNIDYIILYEKICMQEELLELIKEIKNINEKINLIILLEEKNEELEKILILKGVSQIFYKNKTEEVSEFILKKEKEQQEMNLREEINLLKEIITKKDKKQKEETKIKKQYKKIKDKLNIKIINKLIKLKKIKKEKMQENKMISILGAGRSWEKYFYY